MPGFRRWLEAEAKRKAADFLGRQERERLCEEADAKDPHEGLARIMLRGFAAEAHPPESVKPTLMRLCARYLAEAKEARQTMPARSTRSRASTSATARGSSASTGSPTRARAGSSSRRG